MKATLSKAAKPIFFLLLGVFILYQIVRSMSPEVRQETWEAIQQAEYGWVILSISFGILSHLSRAQRWRMLIYPLGYRPRYLVTFLCVMISYVANLALPRLGELLKCTFLSRYERIPADKVVGTMIAERSVDALTLLLITGAMLILQYNRISVFFRAKVTEPMAAKFAGNAWLLPMLAGGFVLLLILAWFGWKRLQRSDRMEKIRDVLRNVAEGLTTVRRLENLPLFIFHSFFIWAMYFAMVIAVFPALQATADLGVSAGMAVLVFGSVGIIATPGGIGAYQLIVKETLVQLYGLSEAPAFAFANIVWGAQTVMIITGGLLALAILPMFRRRETETESEL